MTEISKELVGRMAELIRCMADPNCERCGTTAKARAIVAELPATVDPDLLDAREIAIKYGLPGLSGITSYRVAQGEADDISPVRAILFALKRGRELSLAETGK